MAEDRNRERDDATEEHMVMEHDETSEEQVAGDSDENTTEAEVARLQDELKEAQERLLRQAAEFQNYRRRKEDDVALAGLYGRMRVITEFLDVYDDFERSVEAAGKAVREENCEAAFDSLKTGIDLVYKKFSERLDKLGVEPIEAVGQPFHEDEHEALMQQPAPEGTGAGTVIGEIQKGYRMGDRVLRHAKVVVAQ